MGNPFRAARKRAASGPSDQKDGSITLTDKRGWHVLLGDASDDPNSFTDLVVEGFREHPVVSRGVREIQSSVSEAPIHAHEETADGNLERLVGHDAEEIFRFPNERDNYVELIESAVQHFILSGNVFIRKHRRGSGLLGEVERITLIKPTRVKSAVTDDNDMPLGYRVDDEETGDRDVVLAENIVHIRDTDPLNEIFGKPRLLAAAKEISTDNEASNYVGELLNNHGTPGIIIGVDMTDGFVEPKDLGRAEQKFEDKFGPGSGRGKVGFMPGGQSIHNIGFTLENLEFTKLRAVTREGICTTLGVDPRMIGVGTATPSGNSMGGTEHKEARRKLWLQTVIPMLRRFEAAMAHGLAPEFGEGIKLKFDLSEIQALKEDRNRAFERAANMRKAGSFTTAEVRSEVDMSPELEEDDDTPIVAEKNVVHLPQSIVEGAEAPAEQEDGDDEDDGDEDEDDDQDDGDEEEGDEEERSRSSLTIRVSPAHDRLDESDPIAVAKSLRFSADADPADAWKQFDRFARSLEPDYRRAAQRQFDLERRETLSLLRNTLRDTDTLSAKGIDEESLNEFRDRLGNSYDQYHKDWRRRYEQLTRRTTEIVGTNVGAELGVSFSLVHPLVQDFIQQRPNQLAGNPLTGQDGVPDRTFRAVMDAVDQSFDAGDGTQGMADRIEDVFGQGYYRETSDGQIIQVLDSQQRATLIARTETTAVTNGASRASVVAAQDDTGVKYDKQWITQGDDRVRPEHADMGGEEVASEKEFSNGLQYPSEPNCRCTLLYNLRKDSEDDSQ